MVRNPWVNGVKGLGFSDTVQADLMRWQWGRPGPTAEGKDEWLDSMSYTDL